MAKVIPTPVIGRRARRALPIECTASPAGSMTEADPEHGVAPHAVDPVEFKRILSERDAALERADAAEAGLAELRSDLDALRRAAKDDGFEEGRAEALRIATEQRDADAAQFKRLCDELVDQQRGRVADAEAAAVEVGFAATVKLLGRMKSDNSLLEALVRQSMEQVLAREGLDIYLSPADHGRLEGIAQQNAQDWAGVELHADSCIQMGGCRIEGRAGSLDARLELQIDELRKALVDSSRPNRSREKDHG